ncbi:hypothetical protein NECAME_14809 [Necator americanus]|uniref:Uncharacterized protein n=1 Tax=Necator americanus TaxID=51031 RepID=W2SNF2_NECAM|nr:hypothetical protein NECAME_14809 [Necator americanus]ETN70366.1 hypothetical protein NECAME_14809 [Necator americanus]
MGATDVLPYPRRRSSTQLESLNFRLPGEVEGPSNPYKNPAQQMDRSVRDREQRCCAYEKTKMSSLKQLICSQMSLRSPPILLPLRVLPRHAFSREQARSQSSECLFRTRSQSMHRIDASHRLQTRRASGQNERPHEARRRFASENEENTAQFIERLRKDLIAQVHHSRGFEMPCTDF